MKYKWLYSESNFIGDVNWEKLEGFYNNTFDHILGWEPKANSMKLERQENDIVVYLCFDQLKRRTDPNASLKESEYVIFGDSYALSRQVNEENSIGHIIGNKFNSVMKFVVKLSSEE